MRSVRPTTSCKTQKVNLPLSLGRDKTGSLVDQAREDGTFAGGLSPLAFSQDQGFAHAVDAGHVDLGFGIPGAAHLIRQEREHAFCACPQCPFPAQFFPGMRADKVDHVPADFGQSLILYSESDLLLPACQETIVKAKIGIDELVFAGAGFWAGGDGGLSLCDNQAT